MKVSQKVVLTFAVIIIAIYSINVLNHTDSEYNTGLFEMIIIVGSIAGVITLWNNNPEYLESKKNSLASGIN
jgi:hypothetical protein